MTRNRPIGVLAGAVFVALGIAACGSSGGSNSTASSAPPKTANGRSATIGIANEKLGKILVDSQGRTLYLFQRDTGTKSSCSGGCAVQWPPLRASGTPKVGGGVNASGRCNQRPLGRQAAGHLQRPPALPLLGRPESQRHERTRRERLWRAVVRAVVVRQRDHHLRGLR
jgi:predicted lipoprotein with Yx(FWY)xxD motif